MRELMIFSPPLFLPKTKLTNFFSWRSRSTLSQYLFFCISITSSLPLNRHLRTPLWSSRCLSPCIFRDRKHCPRLRINFIRLENETAERRPNRRARHERTHAPVLRLFQHRDILGRDFKPLHNAVTMQGAVKVQRVLVTDIKLREKCQHGIILTEDPGIIGTV